MGTRAVSVKLVEKKDTIYPVELQISRNVKSMKLLGIFFLVLSLASSLWVAYDVDPMRETCTRFRDEVVVSTGLNALTFLFGACCTFLCGRFLVVAVSALATVSLSRVTLFAYDVKTICAAENVSAPAGDILTDVTVLDRVQFMSWAALAFFALGLLTVHITADVMDCFDISDYLPHRNLQRHRAPRRYHYKKEYRPPCDDDDRPSSNHSTWIRIPF